MITPSRTGSWGINCVVDGELLSTAVTVRLDPDNTIIDLRAALRKQAKSLLSILNPGAFRLWLVDLPTKDRSSTRVSLKKLLIIFIVVVDGSSSSDTAATKTTTHPSYPVKTLAQDIHVRTTTRRKRSYYCGDHQWYMTYPCDASFGFVFFSFLFTLCSNFCRNFHNQELETFVFSDQARTRGYR